MATVITDKTQYIPDNKLEANDDEGRRQSQPLSEDWVETLEPAVGNVSQEIVFSDSTYDTTRFFNLGDFIYLKQSGVEKYFLVADRNNNILTVRAGDDYSLIDEAITNLAFSRGNVPSDFPEIFGYIPDIIPDSGSATVINGSLQFKMQGRLVNVIGQISVSVTSGTPSNFLIELPIPYNASSSIQEQSILAYVNLGGSATSDERISIIDFGPTVGIEDFRVRRITAGTYSGGFDINVSFFYVV